MSSRTSQPDSAAVMDDWLAVSTEGFASMNAGRDPAHLVKELVQNSLDALSGCDGEIVLRCDPGQRRKTVLVTCRDNGCGMLNLSDIRTVFYTSKTDSHLQRGRMGRGFKEMLCLANSASVTSGGRRIEFRIEDGHRITRQLDIAKAVNGTLVEMVMPWSTSVIDRLEEYFRTLLVLQGVRFSINDLVIAPREATQRIEGTLPTELLEEGRWVRPVRKTSLELVPIRESEEPTVHELGIPICPADWTVPHHVNVLQRVPMNPCRDAVASGYLVKLHRVCLPVLLPDMDGQQVRQDWVGAAAPACPEPVQQEVIRRAFGENLARSVPKMGAREFDEDARDLGLQVIDTRHTSGGLREILQEHVPTSKEVVDQHNHKLVAAAAAGGFHLKDVERGDEELVRMRRNLIAAAGGTEHVQRVIEFARWFCQKLLDSYEDDSVCSVKLSLLKSVNALATWSQDDVLSLGLDTPWLWSDPLGEESLTTYIHEAAHHQAAHHGRDFHKELEALAGRAARIMLIWSGHIEREFSALLEHSR